jgi:cytoskeleton protein RodZ
MNGELLMNDAPVPAEVEVDPQAQTAGAMLRVAREAAGLHIAALAVSMKVPVKKLEALEQDRLDPSLEPVFVRALAGSVCRALKIDPAPVLQKLPQNQTPRLPTMEVRKNSAFQAPGQQPGVLSRTNFARPAFLVVPLLLLGIAAVLFFPEIQTPDTLPSAESVAANQVVMPVASQVPPASAEVVDVVSPVVSGPAPATSSAAIGVATEVPSTTAAVPAAAPASSLVAVAAVNPAPKPVDAPLPSVAGRPNLLLFKAKGASWVEVVDSTGTVQLRRILADGETVATSGALPLAVVIGRADAVSIEVRGKAFDLANISKDGVARFEVK